MGLTTLCILAFIGVEAVSSADQTEKSFTQHPFTPFELAKSGHDLEYSASEDGELTH